MIPPLGDEYWGVVLTGIKGIGTLQPENHPLFSIIFSVFL